MATITLPAGSTSADLQTAIGGAASGDVLVLAGDMNFLDVVTVPAGLALTIRSATGNPRTMRQTATERHFLVLGSLSLEDLILTADAVGTLGGTQGGLQVQGSLTLLSGAVIEACANSGGGAVSVIGGLCDLRGGSIRGNFATTGGGVYVNNGGTLNISDGNISGNRANYGGGVYLLGGSVNMGGGLIAANITQNQGSGIYVGNGGRLGMSAGTIRGNQITFDSGSGGGVEVNTGGSFVMSGGVITENTLNLVGAQGGIGGGVSLHSGSFTLTQGTISYNRSQQYGAGVGVGAGAVFTMSGGSIEHNEAESPGGGSKLSGGGVAVILGTFLMSGGSIRENSAKYGGGVFLGYSNTACRFEMRGGSIIENYAASLGGGVHTQTVASSVEISSEPGSGIVPVIRNNRSGYYGGGICTAASTVTMSDGVISENRAVYGGGVSAVSEGVFTVTGGQISDNQASADGGGIYTADYDYSNPASTAAYQNLITAAATLFHGNQAAQAYRPPLNAVDFTNLDYASTSIVDISGYLHPLNNYDINYAGELILELFQVTYEANGGLGGYLDGFIVAGTSYTVRSAEQATVSRPGYSFVGWNTAADGGGLYYEPGDSIVIEADLTLYAQWTLIEGPYDVIYDANGGSGSYGDTGIANGTDYTVLSAEQATISRPGYIFLGWNTEPDGSGMAYQPGDTIVISGNLILYAQWQAAPGTYQVLYCANCRSCCNPEGYLDEGLVGGAEYRILSAAEIRICCPCYRLVGWNTQPDGSGVLYQPGEVIIIRENLILYAQWLCDWLPVCPRRRCEPRREHRCNPCAPTYGGSFREDR